LQTEQTAPAPTMAAATGGRSDRKDDRAEGHDRANGRDG
jgi:hypothetical protein